MREEAKKDFARKLRVLSTDVEQKLWNRLRNKAIFNHKFRRQHTLGPYIVDFACLERHLIVEIDGGQHAHQLDRDRKRTEFLTTKGFHVLRFWNNEVQENLEGVLSAIEIALSSPHPDPLPQAGEGEEGETCP